MTTANRSHSEIEYKELLSENQVLQRKFDSKVEALLKVSQELSICQKEKQFYCNQNKELAERCKALKTALLAQKQERNRKESAVEQEQQNLNHVLNCVKEENDSLHGELSTLKRQLDEAQGDIKLLRNELSKQKYGNYLNENLNESVSSEDAETSNSSTLKVDALKELEKVRSEYYQLERDLKSMLCEKEELIIERDAYKTKTEKLNTELNYILNGDERRVVDIDALVGENRYLKERLQHAQEESGIAKAALSKYKGVLERRKGNLKPTNGHSSNVQLITQKQAKAFLGQSGQDDRQDVDYKALASALYEAVNDKNLALSHQRKANKILGTRVTELENRIQHLELGGVKSPMKICFSDPSLKKETCEACVQCDDERPIVDNLSTDSYEECRQFFDQSNGVCSCYDETGADATVSNLSNSTELPDGGID